MSRLIKYRTLVLVILCGLVVPHKADIVFPDQINLRESNTPVEPRAEDNMALLLRSQSSGTIKRINSPEEFLQMIGVSPSQVFLTSRMGVPEERSNKVIARQANCEPSPTVVPTYQRNDPSIIYFPRCIRVNRCTGCCGNELLSCQPKEIETRNFEIMLAKLTAQGKFEYQGKQVVPIDEHIKCECDCVIKPSDCTPKQVYKENLCRCECSNTDYRTKCIEHPDKIWDSVYCTCSCRNAHECSTGFFYNQNTCRCEQLPISRSWFTSTKGTDYRFGQTQKPDVPPVIIPLDANDPRRKPKPDPE
ncbi:uncharacterized protein LOC132908081 isoform X1 [Bombus pascuorum]|uniref:uncharacterized protein LOC132908081 isoform X1 n=1 Tax=Bombus pascuorum TaxID=65598 RepID=UPI002134FAEF|nr:uncharacterized protein LOC132908081 isoform X1 [Bombus pascuorum]